MNTSIGLSDNRDIPPHETEVLERIATCLMEKSATYAERNEWHRHVVRDTTGWDDPMYWEEESRAKREAMAEVIEMLYRDYRHGECVNIIGLLKELRVRKQRVQSMKNTLTGGFTKMCISGRTDALSDAEHIIRDVSSYGWPENDPVSITE